MAVMRKLRTALDVRFKVTLSFSAHSTGSLALAISTASGSAGASSAGSTRPASPTASAPAARRRRPPCAHARRKMAAPGEPWDWAKGRLAIEHTIDIPGVGLMRQRGDVGSHLGRAQPALKRQALAFPQGDIAAVAPEHVESLEATIGDLALDRGEFERQRLERPRQPRQHHVLEALNVDLGKGRRAVARDQSVEAGGGHL